MNANSFETLVSYTFLFIYNEVKPVDYTFKAIYFTDMMGYKLWNWINIVCFIPSSGNKRVIVLKFLELMKKRDASYYSIEVICLHMSETSLLVPTVFWSQSCQLVNEHKSVMNV